MKKNTDNSKNNSKSHAHLEKELKDSDVRYKELFDNISSGVAVYRAKNNGQDFVFTDFNRSAERIEKFIHKLI